MSQVSERAWAGGRYVQLELLGRGNSGIVYRVHDRDNDAVVALKTLAAIDSESVYRLKQEFRACAGVRHRNLVQLYELHVAEEECFFTMELVEGVDIVRYVSDATGTRRGPQLIRFFAAARQLVDGLAALHAAGRLHRDVKPPNCLVDANGRTVLLDFGFMIPFGPRLLPMERSETIAGSLAYIAPEVLWGEPVTPASDWYSVGVVFHEALSGDLPFKGPPAHLLSRDGRPEPAPLGPQVPPVFAELVGRLLSLTPNDRPDATAVARVIESCSAEQRLATAAPPAPLADETPFVGRHAELKVMHQALDALIAGHTSVVHVRGTSGIGKSELVRQFLSSIQEGDETVSLNGRCHPYETVPYRAFDGVIDSLSRYLGSLPDASVAGLVPRHAGAMVRLFPVLGRLPLFAEWRSRDDSEDAIELRRRGFAAIRELLARLGDRRQLVLWIDDVQWADGDSAALAREVFGGADPPRLLLVLTYRSEDRGAAEAFAGFEQREGGSAIARVPITLGPLGDTDVSELAAHIGQGRVADMAAIVGEAAGSPFFVAQLVRRYLNRDSPDPSQAAGSLSDMLQARAAQLGHSARQLLEAVCVAGHPIELRIAAAAGALAGNGRHELITLQEERLLRLAPAAGAHVEAYHDRIREAVVESLQPAALRERHRSLAYALVREPEPDAPALHRHFLGAGENGPAATWAVEAAERADDALAFGEAAAFYRSALSLRAAAGSERQPLLIKLANALVNAGRGAEAAPLYIEAADSGDQIGGLDLRRKAAEQYLQTGRLGEGVDSIKSLLIDLGLSYPKSERTTVLAIVAGLAGVMLRGIVRSRAPRGLSDRDRLQIETARSAAKGLAMVDPLRGLYFAVQALTLALRSGDPYFTTRELAGLGATLVPAGPPFDRWARRIARRSRAMAQELADPYLLGFTTVVHAQEYMVDGQWSEMLRCCDQGAEILRENCRGVSWELAIAGAAAERALEELGRPAEALRRIEGALQQARETADIVRICSCIQYIGMVHLVQGRSVEAREAAQRSREVWPGQGFQMQHFYALRLDAYAALADGHPHDALRLVEAAWPEIVKSQLLRHALIGLDARLLAARTYLAAAHQDRGSKLVRRALSHARQLRGARTAPALGHFRMVAAGAALANGDGSQATAHLREAAALFATAEMRLAEAAALHMLARSSSDDAVGDGSTAASIFAEAGISDVASHMRLYGFPT